MESITLPVIKLSDNELWIPLSNLSPKIVFRATSIRVKGKVSDPSGHRMEHAEAEGSVKFRPKGWNVLAVS